MDSFTQQTATELAHAVNTKAASAVDVAAAHLEQVERVNPTINAFTRVASDVEEQAAAVDQAVASGASLPLAGVPIVIKDNVDVAGWSTPNGVAALDDKIADADAPFVEHLRDSGAIILGRSNTPEFSWRWHTDNPLFGATLNPLDHALTPGGSSGGSAAALASGMCAVAHGNDAGGSVRWPANCTGTVALRPTAGRVASQNVTAPGERPIGIDLVAVQGPMARTVADVSLMFDVMTKPSWRDPSHVPLVENPSHQMRAGWCLGAGAAPHERVVGAVRDAVGALSDGGWSVAEVPEPGIEAAAFGWAQLMNTDFHMTNRDVMVELGSPAISSMLEAFDAVASPVDLAGMYSLLASRTSQLRQWQRLLTEEIDVLVMPVSMEPAWPVDDDMAGHERLLQIFAAHAPLVALNFLGLPSVAVPTPNGGAAPTGVQIVARRFAESTALDAAAVVEAGSSGPQGLS